jgi:hypothetical protein
MDTNAVIVVLAEPFGLDDRRDIFRKIALQEVRQNFLSARLGVLCPFAAPPAIGSMAKSRTAVLASPHSGRDDDHPRRTSPALSSNTWRMASAVASPLRFASVYAEAANSRVDAARLLSSLSMRRKLRRIRQL